MDPVSWVLSIVSWFIPSNLTEQIQEKMYVKFKGRFVGARTNKSVKLSKIYIESKRVMLYGGGNELVHLQQTSKTLDYKQLELMKKMECSFSLQSVPTPMARDRLSSRESLLINILNKEQVSKSSALLVGSLCIEFENNGESDLLFCGVESGFSILNKSKNNPITMPPLGFEIPKNNIEIQPSNSVSFEIAYAYDPILGTSLNVTNIARLIERKKNAKIILYDRKNQRINNVKKYLAMIDTAYLLRFKDTHTEKSYYYMIGWEIEEEQLHMRSASGTHALNLYAKIIANHERQMKKSYEQFVGFYKCQESDVNSVNVANNLRLVHKAISKARKNKDTRHISIS